METIIIQSDDKKKLDVIEELSRVMGMKVESSKSSPYNSEFVQKIKRGEKAMKKGKGIKLDPENLWK